MAATFTLDAPPRFPIPWGLIALLAAYCLGVVGYVALSYYQSDDYIAAKHYERAMELVGTDEGRRASDAQLEEGYRELLQVALHKPEVRTTHELLEHLNWRFAERHRRVPPDLEHEAGAVAITYRQIESDRAPLLVVGRHDYDWDPEKWIQGPLHVFLGASALLGLLLILVGHRLYTSYRIWHEDRARYLEQHEHEVEALGDFRRGLGTKER